uniref:Cytochrome P450 n=2 Tax=Pectinophora gossypiella TaxID=13191 RepID=A0A1E1WBF9_PECGO
MLWLLVCGVLALVWIFVDWCSKVADFDRIPGPKGIYLIGNGFDFVRDTVKLFYYFRYLASQYKDLYKIYLGPKKVVFVLNPEDIETVISGSKNTSKGYAYQFLQPWLKGGLLLSDGEKWRQRRRILTPAFHFNILKHYKLHLEENCEKFVEQLSLEVDKSKTNVSTRVTEFTLHSICATAMGTQLDKETSEFGRTYKDGIHALGTFVIYRVVRVWLHLNAIFSLTATARKQKEILHLLGSFREKVVDKRRQQMLNIDQNDFVSNVEDREEVIVYKKKRLAMLDLLFQAEKDGAIDAEGISEEVDTFMFEGHDTTASVLQFAFMLLANNPVVQDKVVEECVQVFGTSDRSASMEDLAQMKYLDAVIKETMRLYPPVYFIVRTIDQNTKLRDYCLPAGTDFVMMLYDLHRRSDQFVEPLEFRPERFLAEPTWHPYSYIPFSAGPRNCIGQKFAMMEMKLLLSSVLRRFRLHPVTKPAHLTFFLDFVLRTTKPIYVKVERRL